MREFSVTGNLKFKPVWTEQNGATVIADTAAVNSALNLNSATPELYADAFWKDGFQLTSTATIIDLLDLHQKIFSSSGNLALAVVKAIYVENRSATEDVELFGDVAGRWDGASRHGITVGAGGLVYWTFPLAGAPVAAGSSLVRMASLGSTAEIAVSIVGVQA